MALVLDLPDVGMDNNVWGDVLNTVLTALNTGKADTTSVYTKTETDGRYIRTVNGVGPDGAGNVVVAGGGGGGGAVASVNGKTGTVVLSAADVGARATGVNIPAAQVTGLAGVAVSGAYADLTGSPAAAIPLSQKGANSGVATLDSGGKLTSTQVPTSSSGISITVNGSGTWDARPSGPFKMWITPPGMADADLPGTDGSTSGGGGMVQNVDLLFRVLA